MIPWESMADFSPGGFHGHFFEATPREHWMVYFRENPNIDDNWE